MDQQLYKNIAESTARKESRFSNAMFVVANPRLANDLIAFAMDIGNKDHFKACWILELVLEKNLGLISPKLGDFCDSLLLWTNDSALRSVAKICQICANHLKKNPEFLTETQMKQITEACFQWLISDEKVAVKAYAIRALFQLGKTQSWIYPELIPVLQHGFSIHSAAYKAVAKEVLSKLNK
jgi:hypothetical protein